MGVTLADLLDYTTAGGGHASLKGVGQAIRKEEQNMQNPTEIVVPA